MTLGGAMTRRVRLHDASANDARGDAPVMTAALGTDQDQCLFRCGGCQVS